MKKTLVKVVSHIMPQLMVRLAHHQLNNPQVRKLRDHEETVLATAETLDVPFHDFAIRTYHWKGAGARVMLVHGWEGQAGNFADMILALQKAGYDVVAFDGPSHGHSSKGPTSPLDFSRLTVELLDRFQPKHVISHSFGGVAASFALSQRPEMPIESYLMLTTPDRLSERIDEIAHQVGVSRRVRDALAAKMQASLDVPLETVNVSSFVQQMRVGRGLILHDRNDRVIPLQISQRVQRHWANASLEVVEGTGHFRILRDDAVIARMLRFLEG